MGSLFALAGNVLADRTLADGLVKERMAMRTGRARFQALHQASAQQGPRLAQGLKTRTIAHVAFGARDAFHEDLDVLIRHRECRRLNADDGNRYPPIGSNESQDRQPGR